MLSIIARDITMALRIPNFLRCGLMKCHYNHAKIKIILCLLRKQFFDHSFSNIHTQGYGVVLKMTQLRSSSVHERGSGSSSRAVDFHDCSSGTRALLFHGGVLFGAANLAKTIWCRPFGALLFWRWGVFALRCFGANHCRQVCAMKMGHRKAGQRKQCIKV